MSFNLQNISRQNNFSFWSKNKIYAFIFQHCKATFLLFDSAISHHFSSNFLIPSSNNFYHFSTNNCCRCLLQISKSPKKQTVKNYFFTLLNPPHNPLLNENWHFAMDSGSLFMMTLEIKKKF